jgi:hypothetical protein
MPLLRRLCWLLLAGFAAPLAAQVQISAVQSSPVTPVLRAQSVQFSAQATTTAGETLNLLAAGTGVGVGEAVVGFVYIYGSPV